MAAKENIARLVTRAAAMIKRLGEEMISDWKAVHLYAIYVRLRLSIGQSSLSSN